VWTGDTSVLIYGVTTDRDSVYGLPTTARETCSRCRLAFPLSGIDSMRVAQKPHNAENSFLAGVAIGAILLWRLLGVTWGS